MNIILNISDNMTEIIDIKKIMNSIQNNITKQHDLEIDDNILSHKPIQSFLEQKVFSRIKHEQYESIKKNMDVIIEQTDFDRRRYWDHRGPLFKCLGAQTPDLSPHDLWM